MTRDKLAAWLATRGWLPDRFGHHYKERLGSTGQVGLYRMRLGRLSVRYEVRGELSGRWIRLRSGYYKALAISPEGKLQGLRRQPPSPSRTTKLPT